MRLGGSLSLRQLRERGFSNTDIEKIGGQIQGRNVVFNHKIGGFTSTGEILKLPPRPIKGRKVSLEEQMQVIGPKIWAFIHAWCEAAHTLDEYEQFRTHVARMLPCGECRVGWLTDTTANPPSPEVLADLTKLIQWGVDRHNAVNLKLGKPKYPYDRSNPEAPQKKT